MITDQGGPTLSVHQMLLRLDDAREVNRCPAVHPEHHVQCVRELAHRWLRRGPRRHWHTGVTATVPKLRAVRWVDTDDG